MSDTRVDGRVQRGDQTRRTILRRAADIASVEGLEGLSIGRLATDLNVSKSGVFAHFGSKEELQLATVGAAGAIFRQTVITPALAQPAGLRRLWALFEHWIGYSEQRTFPGGCFFLTVTVEFGSRPGRVRDAVAASSEHWLKLLADTIDQARGLDELQSTVDPDQLAFEISAVLDGANALDLLREDSEAYRRARIAILARLRAVATTGAGLPDA